MPCSLWEYLSLLMSEKKRKINRPFCENRLGLEDTLTDSWGPCESPEHTWRPTDLNQLGKFLSQIHIAIG